jgi:signal transduction histidine kinase/ActR/RegA family two-component response regulator
VTATKSNEEHFLVLAPTGRDAALTLSLLEKAGLSGQTCASLAQLCERFERDGAAALLIAEEVFAQTGIGPLREALSRQSAWSDIPILIFTGTSAHAPVRISSPQLLTTIGNVILLERPLQPISMLSAARSALRARRRQYEARAELLAQQRAVRERDQFLAMLGHELRNPLSAIAMALKLDEQATHSSKYQDIMGRQLGHLTRLVDDLLDVARVTSGKIVLRCEDLDLVALTRRCIAQLQPGLKEHATMELEESTEPVFVHADPVRMEQVVMNLLNNASKYTGAGGRIRAHVSASGDDAVLRVQDSGVGLAPGMIDRVFELFTQAEGSLDRSQGGMGIGLTLVRNLVELHDGSVSVASAGLGQGSEFTVRLPRKVDAAPQPVAAPVKLKGAQRKPCDKVLIVEDNEDSRELLAAILTQRGYRVATAEDGQSGIDGALEQRPQVLLVDIGLPGIDGYGLAREVRSKLGDDVYLVALTGYGQPQDRTRALDAGFDVHLTKPVDIEALERLLANRTPTPSSAHSA